DADVGHALPVGELLALDLGRIRHLARQLQEEATVNESESRPVSLMDGALASWELESSEPWNSPVSKDRATLAAETSLRETCSAPSGMVRVAGTPFPCRWFNSSRTSSSPSPWMNCMT